MPKKYALVDGACGHTGSFLVNELIKNDWHVVCNRFRPRGTKKVNAKRTSVQKRSTIFID